ncbi:MAG: hypothetical protein H9Q66_01100 [Spiroplasma ixodetis]|nr:hypothetical protein [Spiroplasma ixodetis]
MNPIVNNKQGIIESDINSNNTDIGSNKNNKKKIWIWNWFNKINYKKEYHNALEKIKELELENKIIKEEKSLVCDNFKLKIEYTREGSGEYHSMDKINLIKELLENNLIKQSFQNDCFYVPIKEFEKFKNIVNKYSQKNSYLNNRPYFIFEIIFHKT